MGAIFRDKKKLVKYNKYSILYQWNKYNVSTNTAYSLSSDSSKWVATTKYCNNEVRIGDYVNYYDSPLSFNYIVKYAKASDVTLHEITSTGSSSYNYKLYIPKSKILTAESGSFDTGMTGREITSSHIFGYVTVPEKVLILPNTFTGGYLYTSNAEYRIEVPRLYFVAPNHGRTQIELRTDWYSKSNTTLDTYYYPTACWFAGYLINDVYNKTVTNICGSTLQGTVTNSNRSAYPDNGKSNSYWYIYTGEVAGTFIETVSAIKGSLPNGGSKDGYYYELA